MSSEDRAQPVFVGLLTLWALVLVTPFIALTTATN